VTSQAIKYYAITYTPYEGLNCIILENKTTPLWKRIGEPPDVQIGCYRATQVISVTRANHTICSDWLNKTAQRLGHWNFHLLSFWLALSLPCDVMLCNKEWEINVAEQSHCSLHVKELKVTTWRTSWKLKYKTTEQLLDCAVTGRLMYSYWKAENTVISIKEIRKQWSMKNVNNKPRVTMKEKLNIL